MIERTLFDDRKERIFDAIAGYQAGRNKRKPPAICRIKRRSSILARENVSGKRFGGLFSGDITFTGSRQEKII
jgi:hypothetical protein